MPELIRGETSDCTNPKLDVFTKVSGVAADVAELSFQIFEKVTTPNTPIQVYPAVSGDRQSVDVSTLCPSGGKITTGHYHADYTVPLSAPIGIHEIRWFFRRLLTDPEQQFFEEFSVLAGVVASSEDTYTSVADIRALGINVDPPTDQQIQNAICLWQSFIDRATRQWFRPVSVTLEVDGTDSDALHFGVPIISIDSLRINNSDTDLPVERYKVYNGSHGLGTGRKNPRIKLVDEFSDQRDIFTASGRRGRNIFRKGRQNQRIVGTFGCVEDDGVSPPPLIKHALEKLVVEKLLGPVVPGTEPDDLPPPIVGGPVHEEWTDGHRIKYRQSGGTLLPRNPGLAGITDDQEILNIIRLYMAPIGLATPANPSYR